MPIFAKPAQLAEEASNIPSQNLEGWQVNRGWDDVAKHQLATTEKLEFS